MAIKTDFPTIFDQLKTILEPYEPQLSVTVDSSEGYSLDTSNSARTKSRCFLVRPYVNKNYVSFHLMPVYVHPELLDGISDILRKRMQGKSCFNFEALDEDTLAELRQLTERGFEAFRKDGLV